MYAAVLVVVTTHNSIISTADDLSGKTFSSFRFILFFPDFFY